MKVLTDLRLLGLEAVGMPIEKDALQNLFHLTRAPLGRAGLVLLLGGFAATCCQRCAWRDRVLVATVIEHDSEVTVESLPLFRRQAGWEVRNPSSDGVEADPILLGGLALAQPLSVDVPHRRFGHVGLLRYRLENGFFSKVGMQKATILDDGGRGHKSGVLLVHLALGWASERGGGYREEVGSERGRNGKLHNLSS